jgi:hypothetical protein
MASTTTNKNMSMLELFCGTKSVSKVAEKREYKTIYSVDNRKSTKPTWCGDILEFKYKELPFVPDFLWASPPCTTYSVAAGGHHRTKADMKGKTDTARLHDRILKRVVKMIRYFEKKNPNLKWCFENPRGLMMYAKQVEDLQRTRCCYCKYGHKFMKPTDLWSNFPLTLKMCRNKQKGGAEFCHHERAPGKKNRGTAKKGGVLGTSSINERYAIPPKLIEAVLDQAFLAEGYPERDQNKIEILKRKEEKGADMATTTDTQNIMTVDSLNRLYRQAEDEIADLRAEIYELRRAEVIVEHKWKGMDLDPQCGMKKAEPKKITPKEVRAWCRAKYGAEWHKADKDARKTEAKEALLTKPAEMPAGPLAEAAVPAEE